MTPDADEDSEFDETQEQEEDDMGDYYGDFPSLSFPKRGSEIVKKAQIKLDANKRVVDEKTSEIQKTCKDHNLSMVDMLTDLDSLAGRSSKQLPSQEMAKLQALAQRVDALKKENHKLGLVVENLPENVEFNLNFQELAYFGF